MKNRILCLVMALCMLFLIGCQPATPGSSASSGSTAGSTPPSSQLSTEPSQTEPTATEPSVTEPSVTEPPVTEPPATEPPATEPNFNTGSRDPVLAAPPAAEGPCHFYDDAVFIGDSVSIMLQRASNGQLGDALFLPVGSYGVHNATNYSGNNMTISYQGEARSIQDTLAATGKKKVFIMLGMNDIALYGIDHTIAEWDVLTQRILAAVPDMQIYIQSCTPINSDDQRGGLNNENMDAYNARLKEFAQSKGFGFVDVAPYFKDGTNGLAPIYCSDGFVHITATGVQTWINVLKAYAAEQEADAPVGGENPNPGPGPERDPVLAPPDAPADAVNFFNGVVFVGDSVTQGLQLECMRTGDLSGAIFLATKSFGLYNSLYTGFTHTFQGQEVTTEDALAKIGAKKVFLMLGMNDLVSTSPEYCIGMWEEKIARILDKNPDIEIYLQSGTPIYTGSETTNLTNANMDRYNVLLKEFADSHGYHYVDVASYLKDSTGGMADIYCSDNYVHLTSAGAQVWIKVLLAYVANEGAA